MQKSDIRYVLIPFSICAAMLTGLFIGRVTSGDRIVSEDPKASAADTTVAGSEKPTESPNAVININTADADLLTELPGIGPAIAQRIVEHREQYGPFLSIYDLMAVNGIGEKLFEKLIPYITTGGQ